MSARWGTREERGGSAVHFFRKVAGHWFAACGLVTAQRLTRKARLHAGMAARGYACELCLRKESRR